MTKNDKTITLLIIAIIFAVWGIFWIPGVSYAIMMVLFAIYSKLPRGKEK